MSRDHTSDTIDGVFMDNDNASYDATAKGFIAHKVFLAHILKHCVRELRKSDAVEDDFLKMLHLLFRARLKAEEKTKRLKDDFNIVLDNDMRKELNIMCNLSEGIAEEARAEAWAEANKLSAGIAEEAREEGLKEGRNEGRKEGEDTATVRHLKHIMAKMHFTLDEAMDMLGVPEETRSQYAGLVQEL